MTRDALRVLCEADKAAGHDRLLTIREVAILEDWAVGTIKRYVYIKPNPLIHSVKIGDGMKLPRVRVPYTEVLRFFHPRDNSV